MSDGKTKYPTRTPGAIVFENDEAYATLAPSANSKIVGSGSPS